jgi:3-phosphoshikimate 1-carboxyvinyltransferase
MDLAIRGGGALKGEVLVPGDKSISHRALILGAMAEGSTGIENLAPGADVRSTWRCLMALGTPPTSRGKRVTVKGLGWRKLVEPKLPLEAENSGTTMRLLMGVLSGHPFYAEIRGDDSLLKRPMARVAEPLRKMGATIELTAANTGPVKVRGAALKPIDYVSPVASAQVKSAVLLAGLLADGFTSVTEPALSRDHTERMLPSFGINVKREGLKVTIKGGLRLAGTQLVVPGDPSSAAFWVVAAALLPGSDLHLMEINANPTRLGFLRILQNMGAQVQARETRLAIEPVADLLVKAGPLKAVDVPAEAAPSYIDEVPALAVAAALAEGTSRFRGLSELRVKESDRLSGIASLINAFGGEAKVEGDDLVVTGPRKLKGAKINPKGDHRMALAALVAGALAEGETVVTGGDCLDVSYPLFHQDFTACLKRSA